MTKRKQEEVACTRQGFVRVTSFRFHTLGKKTKQHEPEAEFAAMPSLSKRSELKRSK
jgi:hypothetical protein